MKKTRVPWTPDNCPLKPGDVIHDIYNNTDVLILKRFLDYKEDKDNSINSLVSVCLSGMIITLTGKDLAENRWEWYPKWPDTGTSEPCCDIIEADNWLVDYFKWERHLPLADLPEVGKAIKCFKDVISERQNIANVISLGMALKNSIQHNWAEPEPEWFDDIDKAVLKYAEEKEHAYKAKEQEDVEN